MVGFTMFYIQGFAIVLLCFTIVCLVFCIASLLFYLLLSSHWKCFPGGRFSVSACCGAAGSVQQMCQGLRKERLCGDGMPVINVVDRVAES